MTSTDNENDENTPLKSSTDDQSTTHGTLVLNMDQKEDDSNINNNRNNDDDTDADADADQPFTHMITISGQIYGGFIEYGLRRYKIDEDMTDVFSTTVNEVVYIHEHKDSIDTEFICVYDSNRRLLKAFSVAKVLKKKGPVSAKAPYYRSTRTARITLEATKLSRIPASSASAPVPAPVPADAGDTDNADETGAGTEDPAMNWLTSESFAKFQRSAMQICDTQTCWVSCAINSLSVTENQATAIGTCAIQFALTLYWLGRKTPSTTQKKRQTENENEEKVNNSNNRSQNGKETMSKTKTENENEMMAEPMIADGPVIEFLNTIQDTSYNTVVGKPKRSALSYAKFFQKLAAINREFRETEYRINSEDYDVTLYEQRIVCNKVVNEPFEAQAFPFDCQDIPLYLKLENATTNRFEKFAPVLLDEVVKARAASSEDEDESVLGLTRKTTPWITTSQAVSNMRSWKVETLNVEIIGPELRLLIKLSRNWKPISLGVIFIYFCISFLSLATFALVSTAGKLGSCVTLILTVVMYARPSMPFTTLIDKYFFATFFILVMVAVESVFSANPILAASQSTVFAVTFAIVVVVQLVFFAAARYTMRLEHAKLAMFSKEIDRVAQRDMVETKAIIVEDANYATMFNSTHSYFTAAKTPKKFNFRSLSDTDAIVSRPSEWMLISVLIVLQLSIGGLQVLHNNYGCTASNTIPPPGFEVALFLGFACVNGVLLLFVFAAFGIPQLSLRILGAIKYLLLTVNVLISLNFLTFWMERSGHTIVCAPGQISLQSVVLPIIIAGIVLYSLLVAIPWVSEVISNLQMSLWEDALLMSAIVVTYFVCFYFGMLQYINVNLIAHDVNAAAVAGGVASGATTVAAECIAHISVLAVTNAEAIVFILCPVFFLLWYLWMSTFFETLQIRYALYDLGACFTCGMVFVVVLMLVGVAIFLHATVFWAMYGACDPSSINTILLALAIVGDITFLCVPCCAGMYYCVTVFFFFF